MLTATKYLKEKIYLPGYMVITGQDYEGNKAWFDFNPVEPQVTILSDKYLTPRGLHIFLMQAAYCFFEEIMKKIGVDGLDIETLRMVGTEGRIKMAELTQRFRREVGLAKPLQGRLVLDGWRMGRIPFARFEFDIDNKSIVGNLIGVIAPRPVPQTNADIIRNS